MVAASSKETRSSLLERTCGLMNLVKALEFFLVFFFLFSIIYCLIAVVAAVL